MVCNCIPYFYPSLRYCIWMKYFLVQVFASSLPPLCTAWGHLLMLEPRGTYLVNFQLEFESLVWRVSSWGGDGCSIETSPQTPQISSHQFRTPWLHYSSLSPLNFPNPRQTSDYLINIQYWKHFQNSQHSKACYGWMEIIKALFKCGSCAKILHSSHVFIAFVCFLWFCFWSGLTLI